MDIDPKKCMPGLTNGIPGLLQSTQNKAFRGVTGCSRPWHGVCYFPVGFLVKPNRFFHVAKVTSDLTSTYLLT
jgi:hypothetical protein